MAVVNVQCNELASGADMSLSEAHPVICGLIGENIGGSFSPDLHQEEARALGIPLVYRILDASSMRGPVGSLAAVISVARQIGFAGVNITHPYKQRVIGLLDDLSPEARRLGAVNTVVFSEGGMVGHNTDWSGFARSLAAELPGADKRHVVQIGAGGAGSAVAYGLLSLGTRALTLVDTDSRRAGKCRDRLTAMFPGRRIASIGIDGLIDATATATGLVNATPVGMVGFGGTPVPVEVVRPDMWVADVVYRPVVTELVRVARAAGARAIGGAGMNAYQAVEAFTLFTGAEPNAERMYAHVCELAESGQVRAAGSAAAAKSFSMARAV